MNKNEKEYGKIMLWFILFIKLLSYYQIIICIYIYNYKIIFSENILEGKLRI